MVATGSDQDTPIRSVAALRDRRRVFRDRIGAGARLARLIAPDVPADAVVFGLAPGGVPVAQQVSRFCRLPLEIAVVAPVVPPWNAAGPAYGAVAWDGSVQFDQTLLEALQLDRRDAARAIDGACQSVAGAIALVRGDRGLPVITDRPATLVDDGSAPVIVIEAAAAALRNAGARQLWVAVAASTRRSVQRLATVADRVYCVNLHFSCRFQAADAYLELAPLTLADAAELTRPRPGSFDDAVIAPGVAGQPAE